VAEQKVTSASALQQALVFLNENLRIAWRPGERLPTTQQLASMAGVSRGTMAKAVAALATEGKLTATRRRGIIVGRPPARGILPLPPRPLQKWEQLKRRVEFDIFDGDFHKVAHLPATKQLQVRYGVDFRTLKKALAGLVTDKVLRLQKRTYVVVRPEDTVSESAVVYVTPVELYRTRYRTYPEAGDMVRLLESECGRRKLQFRPFATADREAFHKVVRDYRTLGGLFYHSGQYPVEIFEEFAAMRKPMAMFDNYNHAQQRFAQAFLTKCRMRVFQFDEVFAGNEVGRFLLRLGHRAIAFISPFHSDWVYPIRCESVRQAFESAGPSNRVELVAVNNLREGLMRRATEILERRQRQSGPADTDQTVSQELAAMGLTEGSDEVLLSWASESQSWNVNPDHVFSAVLHRELHPLFEQALALPGVTAWVCANDGIAIHALRFLHMRKVPVPEQVSVVGFDNTGDASYNNLTSYDFDVSAIALKMLDHILRPDSSLFPASQRVVSSEGMVIPRGSTMRLRPAADGK